MANALVALNSHEYVYAVARDAHLTGQFTFFLVRSCTVEFLWRLLLADGVPVLLEDLHPEARVRLPPARRTQDRRTSQVSPLRQRYRRLQSETQPYKTAPDRK